MYMISRMCVVGLRGIDCSRFEEIVVTPPTAGWRMMRGGGSARTVFRTYTQGMYIKRALERVYIVFCRLTAHIWLIRTTVTMIRPLDNETLLRTMLSIEASTRVIVVPSLSGGIFGGFSTWDFCPIPSPTAAHAALYLNFGESCPFSHGFEPSIFETPTEAPKI